MRYAGALAYGTRAEGATHIDDLRPGECAAGYAFLGLDGERDKRAQCGSGIQPQPAHVAELPKGKLVEKLFAVSPPLSGRMQSDEGEEGAYATAPWLTR